MRKRKTIYQRILETLAKREGKKHQAQFGDIKELVGILAEILVQDPRALRELIRIGIQRTKH